MKKTLTKTLLVILSLIIAVGAVFAFTACDEIEHGYLPSQTLRFEIDTVKTSLDSLNPILMTAILSAALDMEESYIELNENGLFTCILTIDVESVLGLVGTFLGDMNIGELTEGLTKSSLQSVIDGYVKVMFPGFDLSNAEESLGLLRSCGVELFGLDRTNTEVDKLFDCIEDPNSDRLIPADLDLNGLPATIGLKIQGPYKLLDITETKTVDGQEARQWTFATVGSHDSDTVPYINFSYTVYEDGSESLIWRNEVIGITVAGSYTPE